MNQNSLDKLEQLLNTLQNDLKSCHLWREQSPSPEQLGSQEPFCVDTLPFEQWLQWLFIPKMRAIIAMPNFNGLPHRSDIHTMADYVFQSYETDTDHVVNTIQRLDEALNAFGQPSVH